MTAVTATVSSRGAHCSAGFCGPSQAPGSWPLAPDPCLGRERWSWAKGKWGAPYHRGAGGPSAGRTAAMPQKRTSRRGRCPPLAQPGDPKTQRTVAPMQRHRDIAHLTLWSPFGWESLVLFGKVTAIPTPVRPQRPPPPRHLPSACPTAPPTCLQCLPPHAGPPTCLQCLPHWPPPGQPHYLPHTQQAPPFPVISRQVLTPTADVY